MLSAPRAANATKMSRLQLRTPSFRSRLRLFFVVIVVVPMITMAVVLFRYRGVGAEPDRRGRLAEAQTVSQQILRELEAEAGEVARQIGQDQQLADAVEVSDDHAVQQRLDRLAREEEARYVQLQLDGLGRFQSGGLPAVAPATRRLVDESEDPTGRLRVAMLSPEQYASRISKLTGAGVVVEQGDSRLATTSASAPTELPDDGAAAIEGTDYRVQSFEAPAVGGDVTVRLLLPDQDTADPLEPQSLGAAAAFVGFLVLAFIFPWPVSRRLQSEIQRLLVAAQRLGSGDFSVPCRPRATTSSPRSARSSTRWRASSSPAWRSSSASARGCRRRSAGSASRSPPASTASRCWRSSCRPPSTASARPPAAPPCAIRRTA